MSQKIVIKTSVSKTPPETTSVTYQWHWKRIFMATAVFTGIASAGVYGVVNSVNADEANAIVASNNEVTVTPAPAMAINDEANTPDLASPSGNDNQMVMAATASLDQSASTENTLTETETET